jgi:glycosyltransferase involved in cell wall biosynthesis
MGRPIVSSRVGDAADLIRKYDCGTVVDDNSPAELIRGFQLMHRSSAEKRSEMARNARRLAESEFNIEVVRNSLSMCIDDLMK